MAPNTTECSKLITGCIACGKQNGLLQCSQCKVVHFCGQEHQRKYWPEHKIVCKKIGKARKELEVKQKNARDTMTDMMGIDAASIMGRKADGNHRREQLRLAGQILEIPTHVAVETALDHMIDLRNLPISSNCDVLEMVASCLIRLGRD
ncbi:hypothetical protein BU23DRAFT_15559 [Bimuria novae-zelandiae CBS 107.79]|uniref:MYND-type domain-containing protein n=1 Tax=Bimuria novae-zelandiae CBS 107.79 TaxID=1447943 RepID=A0A6A5VUM3_9PLEO|nr:hypothetical protein BU23DRAFT_15559 [Bimuria novae-zelandiae CBS 107.79]